ncbi:MAG: DUF5687 family protein [Ginsengibacter sp.]
MYFVFLRHQWKQFWRGRNLAGSIISKILLGFMALYFLLLAIGLGFFLKELITQTFPAKNPVFIFNGFIAYYFMVDFVFRIQFQELPTLSIVPYLHLPVRKNALVNFLNLRAAFSVFNFIPLLLFLPFCFTEIAGISGKFAAAMYAVVIFSLTFFNNYLVLYLKRKSVSKVWYLVVAIAVPAAFFALEYFKIISIAEGANWVLRSIAVHPLRGFIFLIVPMAIFIINSAYLRSNLYVEEISKKARKRAATDYPFLNRFGKTGELVALEIKLILRNKRTKSLVSFGLVFMFYGFIMFKEPDLVNDKFMIPIFAALFITGNVILGYGQLMFGWQGGQFDGLLANNIDFKTFIKAKFLLFNIFMTFVTLLSFLYAFISWKLIPIIFATYLFNIGFNTSLILYLASYRRQRIDLSRGAMFNRQGSGFSQVLAAIPMFVLPLIIFWPFYYLHKPFAGVAAIGLFGLAFLLTRNLWLNIITNKFAQQRYKIAEGFRE